MKVPKKYQRFLDQGVEVEQDKKAKTLKFTFTNLKYELVRQFLLVLDPMDFKPYELILYIWGPCEMAGCNQLHGGESAGETLRENIHRVRDMQARGGHMYIHVCPVCSLKMWGTLGMGEENCRRPAPAESGQC